MGPGGAELGFVQMQMHMWMTLVLLVLGLVAPFEARAASALWFEPTVLADLGIEVTAVTTAPASRPGGFGFAAAESSDLWFAMPGGDFEGFGGGTLRHEGELSLRFGGEAWVLDAFELRVSSDPRELELFDRSGRRWFRLQYMHPHAGGDELELRNVDIALSQEFAQLLGQPGLAGSYVGVAEISLPLPTGAVPLGGTTTCSEPFDLERDIELLALGTVAQIAREADVRVALAFPAELTNSGTAAIEWLDSIEPDADPADVGPHPYLALSVYRLADGRLTQIGRGDVKHAFFAVNSGCSCLPGHVLYPGCDDVYGTSTNSDRLHLASRDEIASFSGEWLRLGSHFDGLPVDDFRHHEGEADHDAFEHRLVVAEADLETPGARYFAEAWYLVGEDVDLLNSMGHIEVTPTFGINWTFPQVGSFVTGSIVDELVDPLAPPAGSANQLIDTSGGRLQLAVATTDLGGGLHRYEYALMNFDFDRQIAAFSLPLTASAAVSNPTFDDGDSDAGNDWLPEVGATGITWTAPPGAELDWGTLYSFGFDAASPPVATLAELAVLESGGPPVVSPNTLGPAAAPQQVPGLTPWALLVLAAAGIAFCYRPRRRSS